MNLGMGAKYGMYDRPLHSCSPAMDDTNSVETGVHSLKQILFNNDANLARLE